MEIINLESEITPEKFEQVEKLINIAKEMMSNFITDKLGKNLEDATKVLDSTKVYLDGHSIKGDTLARYEGSNIRLGSSVWNRNTNKGKFGALTTIIHEFQHKFSNEIAKGERAKALDEGFSDVFADECVNYFLQKHPEELKEIGIEKVPKTNISSTDYVGENEFVRMILEAIRAKNGRHYEAEAEYILGEKSKFLDIVRETLGEEVVQIIQEQQEKVTDNKQLGEAYNKYTFNSRLEELIKGIQFEYDNGKDIEKRKDGTVNIFLFRQTVTQKIAKLQKIEKGLLSKGIDIFNMKPQDMETFKKIAPNVYNIREEDRIKILQGYCKNCKNAEDVKVLIDSGGFGRSLEAISTLVDSKSLNTHDLLELIRVGTMEDRIAFLEKPFLDDKQMQELINQIHSIDINKYSENEIDTILKIAIKNDKPNQNLLQVLEEIEQSGKDESQKTNDRKMQIMLAKIEADEEPKGKKIAELLNVYFQTPNKLTEESELPYFIYNKISRYLENEAKDDPKGLNAVLGELKVMEKRLELDKDLSQTFGASMHELIKTKVFDLLQEDLGKISNLIDTKEVQIADIKSIQSRNIEIQKLDEIISIPDNNSSSLIQTLVKYNKDTKLINLFGDNIIEQCLKNRICKATEESYSKLDMEDRKKFLGVLTQMLGKDTSELDSIDSIVNLYQNIMRK